MIRKVKISYPVTLSEAKTHLNLIDSFSYDAQLTSLIKVSTQLAENYIDADIAKTLNTVKEYDFNSNFLKINESHLLNITHIITDASTLYTGGYTIEEKLTYFTINLNSSISSDPLTVQYYAGFDPSINECPDVIKQAILIKVADLFDIEKQSYQQSNLSNNKIFETFLDNYKNNYFVC